jgi:inner membrane protease subunit 1
MLPTLAEQGEIVIEDSFSHRRNPNGLARGDLVTLKSPLEHSRIICKRVIGLPGDTICVDPTGKKAPSTEHAVVPKGHVWIIGDNAAFSRDSSDYGPVSISLIQARLIARVGANAYKAILWAEPFTGLASKRSNNFPQPDNVSRLTLKLSLYLFERDPKAMMNIGSMYKRPVNNMPANVV